MHDHAPAIQAGRRNQLKKRHHHGDNTQPRSEPRSARPLRLEETGMILVTFFFLLITLDTAYQSWQVGMRQIGVIIAACGLLGFGGALITTSPLLFIPLLGVLTFCSLANAQMRKYQVGPYRPRPVRHSDR
jgi:hypothetical protein